MRWSGQIGHFRFHFHTYWGWFGTNFSLRGVPDSQDIVTFSSEKPIPWWVRIGPFAISWRWS